MIVNLALIMAEKEMRKTLLAFDGKSMNRKHTKCRDMSDFRKVF